ncbi:YkgJ family cysteine cluster protein [Candidatus Thorarchaeota archaeon]|nr:MAG: YkgJ family cysteine cluster protein [Candidatus Thorarchaeota archaeon]
MTLTMADINRIRRLGYDPDDFMKIAEDGFAELRNIDGCCYFYDVESASCKVYQHRPEGCRYYPIVYDMALEKCVVDNECPSGSTISQDEIDSICLVVKRLVETLVSEARNVER